MTNTQFKLLVQCEITIGLVEATTVDGVVTNFIPINGHACAIT